jgi:6-phosphogluconolactonase (cycloisomerase 2 family)
LLSTQEYYEIHIVHSQPEETFQLNREGRQICKKVWDAVSNILSNSLSEPLQHYTTACECIMHRNDEHYDGHVMAFTHNPDDCTLHLAASCLKDKTKPISVKVDDTKQSVIVWFKVRFEY